MSEATKAKLKHWGVVKGEADKLEEMGILTPSQIQRASEEDLVKSGLSKARIKDLKKVLPKDKS